MRSTLSFALFLCVSAAGVFFGTAGALSAETIHVPAGGNLQTAINSATPGDTIVLQAGATYTGNFTLPNKGAGDRYITIRSSTPDAELPADGVRISPAQSPLLAKIRSATTTSALRTAAGAHHWRLMFLHFQANAHGAGDVIRLGSGGADQNSLSLVPSDIVVDRVIVAGDPLLGQKRGIALNAARVSIVNSYINECKAVGQDSQAIGGWNGPGPYLIENNYLEAAGENVMFGGADPKIPGLVPSDIVIRRNHLAKPLAWRGSKWTVKNLLELKAGRRVTIDQNLLENNWPAAQVGYAVLFKSVNQDGGCNWCEVRDVTFTNNVVRNVPAGININAIEYYTNDPADAPGRVTNVTVRNNLFYASGSVSGALYWMMLGGGPAGVVVDRNTIIHEGRGQMYMHGKNADGSFDRTEGLLITNNHMLRTGYGIRGEGGNEGADTLKKYGGVMTGNVVAGAPAASYPAGNLFPSRAEFERQFVSFAAQDFRIRADIPYANAGASGTPVGAAPAAPVPPPSAGPNAGASGTPVGAAPAAPVPAPSAGPAPAATDTGTAARRYYLAEGATGAFFDLDVSIANPNGDSARVNVEFMTDGGRVVSQDLILAARSRRTIRVDAVASVAASAVSTIVTSLDGLPLVVERSMFWGEGTYGGHLEAAVDAPSVRWYFAEGSQGFFDTFILVANVSAEPAQVTLTFLVEGGPQVTRSFTVAARARFTVHTGSIPALAGRAFSVVVDATVPVVAERAMYFGTSRFWDGGHGSAGVAEASTTWFHAEGATGPYFDTFLLVGNPNAMPATVTMTYMLESGVTITKMHTIPALSRKTVDLETEDPRLANAAVSTQVTSDVPVISERAMYWPGGPATWREAHNSFGVTQSGLRWGIADGRAGGAEEFETFLLLANPSASQASVRVTFLRDDGGTVVRDFTLPATSRLSVHVNSAVPALANERFGAVIESMNQVPVIVERTMYWNARGERWSGGSNAAATLLP